MQNSLTTPTRIYCNNKATISITHNPVLDNRTKDIEVDKHFIEEKIEAGTICIPHFPTSKQIADVLTKGLPKNQFDRLIDKLAMEDIFKLGLGERWNFISRYLLLFKYLAFIAFILSLFVKGLSPI